MEERESERDREGERVRDRKRIKGSFDNEIDRERNKGGLKKRYSRGGCSFLQFLRIR